MSRHALLWLLVILFAFGSWAQEPLPHRYVELDVDSGDVRNRDDERAVTFSESVKVEGASWLRLFFSQADLAQVDGRADGTVLRITSLKDGAVQDHTAATLAQWQRSSAFFNGDSVLVELIADPEADPSRIRITEVMAGEPAGPQESICGPLDDRILSNDARAARVVPVGCSVWLIDDAEGCFLTAGHCLGASLSVVEFNVPLSNPDGTVNHPSPADQYAVDPASAQGTGSGIGNDYGYFGAFPNSQTQLTPVEVQGTTYVLGTVPSPGVTIRITGYGSVDGTQGTPLDWNQVQKTHTGPLTGSGGTSLQYAVDTTGGNSGSAVLNDDNNTAIGIHTHAGCNAGGGANNGTSLNNTGLQNALANPIGVCVSGPRPLRIELASEIVDPVPAAGTSFQVDILDRDGNPAVLNSANLVYDAGGGDQTVPLTELEGGTGTHQATLPAIACGSDVTFRVDADSGGTVVSHPFSADPSVDHRYRRRVADAHDTAFRDTFETDMGWTVDNDPGLTAGAWERAIPAGYGLREDPPWDGDSSGQCYVTEAAGGNTDVDGGASRLISPAMDGTSGSDPHITYWRWWADQGASDDTFTVELSDDDGGSWVTLETIGPGVSPGAWVFQSFRVADFVDLTDQLRIRFTASDVGGGSVVEAGVDGVALYNTATGVDCSGIFSDGFESGDTSSWSSTSG